VRVKVLSIVAVVLFFSGPASSDESPTEALENFGFFGRWAMDCDQPASPTNNVRVSRMSAGSDPVFSENLGGSGEPNSYVVLRTKRTSDDTIVLRTKLNGEIVQELTMRRDGDRIQTVTNRDLTTGRYVVRKGVIVGTAYQTPWLTRCAAQETPTQKQN
jgi:hypothetical protein